MKDGRRSYKDTLIEIQDQLPNRSKLLSKILHFYPIEIILGLTDKLFGPYVLLCMGMSIVLSTSAVYLIGLTTGYVPYGFEQVIILVVGYFVGLIFELLKRTK